MKVIHSRNVNEAYTIGLNALDAAGNIEDSRVGQVKVFPTPVSTVYTHPQERVLFNEQRDANPFFHLMEGLWMLAGHNDVEWISHYNSTFGQFSDDGVIFNAAYGYRWRHQFNRDQLSELISMLRKDPNTRRAVISMWDPYADFNAEGKDFPCNLNIAFRVRDHKLTMTVFNRSNDAVWGAYGANAVHMSMLQEYIASAIGIEMGVYTQVSNDFHAYIEVLNKVGTPDPHPMDPYQMGIIPSPHSMIDNPTVWNETLDLFMADTRLFHKIKYKANYRFETIGFSKEPFFMEIAIPMVKIWGCYKHKDYKSALRILAEDMVNSDWKQSCKEWILRRAERHASKNAKRRRSRQKMAYDN